MLKASTAVPELAVKTAVYVIRSEAVVACTGRSQYRPPGLEPGTSRNSQHDP